MPGFNKALATFFGLVILGGIVTLIYSVAFLEPADAYTEFYILGQGGRPENYPEALKVGEEGTVTLVVINREKAETIYNIEVRIDGITTDEITRIGLERGGKYEGMVSFKPQKPGKDVKVEFLLFIEGRPEVRDSLYLLVDVQG